MAIAFDPASVLVGVLVALALFLILDLAVAGGGMSSGMMGAMSTPWGWIILVLLALLVAAQMAR